MVFRDRDIGDLLARGPIGDALLHRPKVLRHLNRKAKVAEDGSKEEGERRRNKWDAFSAIAIYIVGYAVESS